MQRLPKVGWLVLAAAWGCLSAAPANARERLDLVVLTNGDRVHGEIISLDSANLVVRTTGFGTVDVDWPDVAALASPQLFEVELASGRRLVGSLAASAPSGFLALTSDPAVAPPGPDSPVAEATPRSAAAAEATTPTGAALATIALSEVVAIRQRGATLWQSHRGYLDLGWNFASANSDSELSIGAEFTLRGPRLRWSNDLAVSVRDDDGSEQRQRWQIQSLIEIPRGNRWIWAASGIHQRNDDLDLTERQSLLGAAFWIAARSATGRLMIGAGAAESREVYAGEDGATSVTSGMVAISGDFDRFGPHSTQASFKLVYLPAMHADGRYRIDAEARLRQKIARNFTLTLSPYYTFDSHPPREALLSEDWGVTSSIGWLF